MNIRDLQYVVAVARYRHFGKAAEACFAGQSTLSVQIKKLEEQLGVQLFERTNRSVTLTPIGEEIVDRARAIIEMSDAMRELARSQQDPMSGVLRLGVIPTIGPYLVPELYARLREQYPKLELVMTEAVTDQIISDLLDHSLDVIIIGTETSNPELEKIKLFKEPFWLAHHRNSELYHVEEISDKVLREVPLLFLSDGHCLADQIKDLRGENRMISTDTTDRFRASSLETLLQFVAAEAGATVVPALALRGPWTTDTGVVVKPLKNKKATRTVSLVYRQTFTRLPAVKLLAEMIVENLPNTVTAFGGRR